MVHTFTVHDLKLALDVESGALHITDDAAFLGISRLSRGFPPDMVKDELASVYGQQTARQIMAEIDELMAGGTLFSERRPAEPGSDEVVKALCLNLAHDCNLRCRYCFAGAGNYGGDRRLMPYSVARKAVDFLLAAGKNRRHCEIDFFGGEPLLNFEVLRQTVDYGRKRAAELGKILKFTVTTNALHLPRTVRDYLNREEISIVLSLDGREEIHDRMRILPGGGKSWRRVLDNCQALVDGRSGSNYFLRGTYTRHNLDFTEDVKAMAAEGFRMISLEPAVLSPNMEEALREEDLPALLAEYEKLAAYLWDKECGGKKIDFFHFELELNRGPCAKKRVQGCGAGTAYLAVAPDGSIYPCHQFVGEDDFLAGNVHDGINTAVPPRFLSVAEKEACGACFARFFCGGGCHAAAWLINKNLSVPYALGCELQKKRVECGLYLQAKRLLAKQGG